MKKTKYLLLLCVFTVALTGCVKFNASMDIKKDKSMDFSIIYAFDKTIFGENGLKEENFDEVKKQGFTITKYSEGNYEGFIVTKKIKNIDEVSTLSDVEYDLSGMMEEKNENNYIFKVVKGEEKNTYTAKFKFDSNDSGLNSMDDDEEEIETPDEEMSITENSDIETTESDTSNMDFSSMMKNLDLSFTVKLPNSAISSNATTKENDNKNLTWKLTTEGKEYIEFSFALDNNISGSNMLLYVGIGVIALVSIAAVIILTSKKKSNNIVESEEKK